MEDWQLLKKYIIEAAPDTLTSAPMGRLNTPLTQFDEQPVDLDGIKGSSITFLEIETEHGFIVTGEISGRTLKYDYSEKKMFDQDQFESGITSFIEHDSTRFVTMVGNLNPSEIPRGKIYEISPTGIVEVADKLHRPVHTSLHDFNKDGAPELLVSEFGNLSGALSLWSKEGDGAYTKKVLMGQPGVIRTIIKDMDKDGKADVVALSSQGNEGITIHYQKEEMGFRAEQVVQLNPVYGSSWFDLMDYNQDGHDDIIIVQGDNADRTYVHKPYHGMRIFLNDGQNHFEEKFFFPLFGATRLVGGDFDKDGDLDFGLLSSFPDYENGPEYSFVYLENVDPANFGFKSYGLDKPLQGRWLLMDSGDIDHDGDTDIVLSSFTYYFTPVPNELHKKWSQSDVDLLVLENKLYQ